MYNVYVKIIVDIGISRRDLKRGPSLLNFSQTIFILSHYYRDDILTENRGKYCRFYNRRSLSNLRRL